MLGDRCCDLPSSEHHMDHLFPPPDDSRDWVLFSLRSEAAKAWFCYL